MTPLPVRDALLGLATGDALGVPVEFRSRAALKADPVTGMRAYGTHRQPAGTWSDDSSMSFCLAESLCQGYDLRDIATRFVAWRDEAYWTPYGDVFDIGITTSASISELKELLARDDEAGLRALRRQSDPQSNGNGSLMRTLPLYFAIATPGVETEFHKIWEVSALTHRHIRSALACLVYLIMADELIRGLPPGDAYAATCRRATAFFHRHDLPADEMRHFDRLLVADITALPEEAIRSGGYVIHSLEASFWCLLTSDSYAETVLKAVNLGDDTDTTGAIAGGLAGLAYGADAIPREWVNSLARREDIEELAERLKALT